MIIKYRPDQGIELILKKDDFGPLEASARTQNLPKSGIHVIDSESNQCFLVGLDSDDPLLARRVQFGHGNTIRLPLNAGAPILLSIGRKAYDIAKREGSYSAVYSGKEFLVTIEKK